MGNRELRFDRMLAALQAPIHRLQSKLEDEPYTMKQEIVFSLVDEAQAQIHQLSILFDDYKRLQESRSRLAFNSVDCADAILGLIPDGAPGAWADVKREAENILRCAEEEREKVEQPRK